MTLGTRGIIEVGRLGPYPLLLLDTGYGLRRAFDAACRIAGLKPNIRLESRSPHTLLALAEAQHGVAIIATTFRALHFNLKIVRITYRGRPLREPLAVLWDKRRPLPRYAAAFCQMWTEHVRALFPITQPTKLWRGTKPEQAKGRRTRQDRGRQSGKPLREWLLGVLNAYRHSRNLCRRSIVFCRGAVINRHSHNVPLRDLAVTRRGSGDAGFACGSLHTPVARRTRTRCFSPRRADPDALRKLQEAEIAKWWPLLKAANIKAE
jgi:LysR substrate binding domain